MTYQAEAQDTSRIPRCASTRFQKSFAARTITEWNSLPDSITSLASVSSFRIQLSARYRARRRAHSIAAISTGVWQLSSRSRCHYSVSCWSALLIRSVPPLCEQYLCLTLSVTLLSSNLASTCRANRGHYWTTSGQTRAHVLTCTNGVLRHLNSVTAASGRPWVTLSIRVR